MGEQCEHKFKKLDAFAQLPSVTRYAPGDCVCAECGQPLPWIWNRGKPRAMTEAELSETSK